MDGYGRFNTCIAYKDTKMDNGMPLPVSLVARCDLMLQSPYISPMHTEIEAVLVEDEDDAVSTARSSLLLWGFGLTIIVGNLILNPLWEGPWYAKLWLPAVYVGALAVLLVSKYNRRTEHGKVVFEDGWIRVVPKAGERESFRMAELEDLQIHPGKPGFFRNPFVKGSVGRLQFRHNGDSRQFMFRLRTWEHAQTLDALITNAHR